MYPVCPLPQRPVFTRHSTHAQVGLLLCVCMCFCTYFILLMHTHMYDLLQITSVSSEHCINLSYKKVNYTRFKHKKRVMVELSVHP